MGESWYSGGGYRLDGEDCAVSACLSMRGRNLRLLSRAGGVEGGFRDEAEGGGVMSGVKAPLAGRDGGRLRCGGWSAALR